MESGAGALVGHGCIKTSPAAAMPERLAAIHKAVSAVVAEFAPDAVAIEEMFFVKVANTIRMTLQARGVIVLAAAQAGKPVHEYNPKTVKLTLSGSGTGSCGWNSCHGWKAEPVGLLPQNITFLWHFGTTMPGPHGPPTAPSKAMAPASASPIGSPVLSQYDFLKKLCLSAVASTSS